MRDERWVMEANTLFRNDLEQSQGLAEWLRARQGAEW